MSAIVQHARTALPELLTISDPRTGEPVGSLPVAPPPGRPADRQRRPRRAPRLVRDGPRGEGQLPALPPRGRWPPPPPNSPT